MDTVGLNGTGSSADLWPEKNSLLIDLYGSAYTERRCFDVLDFTLI